ncbi:MAG: hydroxymethylglutaryl-CoA lyase [Deltaproteobacteria bacterium]|nr:hydroxymethylglutaryl-CoA lyase [Deltaproteobacteria bacterium]MCB9786494.1 hydroxymethylglutaryl-CoA lyase [Deltaproteobacteria bacterium]
MLITEVGPRDGLQNEAAPVSSAAKVAFVEALVRAGVRQIEVTSFVHPSRVPAMADAEAVYAGVRREPGVRYLALTPNERGYERATAAGCDAVAVFTAASEDFTRANIGMSIDESLERFRAISREAQRDGVAVRGYVSTVFACPFAGPIAPEAVLRVVEPMLEGGCYEVSLGDTIGIGTPADVSRLLDLLLTRVPADKLALHLHDTWGMAAANTLRGLDHGIRSFDSSAGGLGGCPYAPGATGNAATEDLVHMLHALGHDTGLDVEAVALAADAIAGSLDHALVGRAHQAILARRRRLARAQGAA